MKCLSHNLIFYFEIFHEHQSRKNSQSFSQFNFFFQIIRKHYIFQISLKKLKQAYI